MDLVLNETNALIQIGQLLFMYFSIFAILKIGIYSYAIYTDKKGYWTPDLKKTYNDTFWLLMLILGAFAVIQILTIITQSPKVSLKATPPTFTEMRDYRKPEIRDLSPPTKDFEQRIKEFDQIELSPVE